MFSFCHIRFSYPYDLALVRPGVLIVTDSVNNKLRVVDINNDKVTTLTDTILVPMSIAYNPETTVVYVGGADGLYHTAVPGKWESFLSIRATILFHN